nr:retrovirus-related Pol polyprotein from transposon TNT 1-94 [Tanacetum cinerariifolium]
MNEIPSQQDLDNLFGPLYEEYYAPSTSEVSKDSTTNILDVENTQSPTLIIVEESDAPQIVTSSGEPITQDSSTLVLESHSDEQIQKYIAELDRNTIMHSFEYLEFEEADSSSNYQDPSNMHELRTDAEFCIYALTMSLTEPKNIKEAMLDHSWIESMQDDLNQFKRLGVWELVPLPEGRNAIKVKWLWKNKKDAENTVCRFGLENCDTVPTPMVEQAKVKLDLVGKPVDHTDYRSMIGSLMYVTSSRPDIMFATCMCARYQANPNEHHVSAVKRIFRYLKGTINLGVWYPKDSTFDLTTYSDADHTGCHLDRKSTSDSVQFLGDKLVCWSSKKQNFVSISTAESEYVTVFGYCAQVLWMRTQLTDYGFFYDKVSIYCDSKSAIAISCNLVQHTWTKHIDVRYHFIKDHVEKGTIELYFIGTKYQLVDLFTKSLPEARFKCLVEKLGMMSRET